jgi:hypothetical protein
VLVVADNAANTDQVLPLVPSTPDSRLVVTTRRRLTALASYHADEGSNVTLLSL